MEIINPPGMNQSQVFDVANGYVKTVTPSSGQTVSFDANNQNQSLVINGTGILTSLTINLPTDAQSQVSQELTVASGRDITLLTINNGTVWGAPDLMAVGECWRIKKILSQSGAATWARIV